MSKPANIYVSARQVRELVRENLVKLGFNLTGDYDLHCVKLLTDNDKMYTFEYTPPELPIDFLKESSDPPAVQPSQTAGSEEFSSSDGC